MEGETLVYAVTVVSEQVIVMIVEHECLLNRVQLFATLWTIACQALLSMGFLRQKYWSGVPFPSPGHLPNSGVEPTSPVSPELAGRFLTAEPSGKPR